MHQNFQQFFCLVYYNTIPNEFENITSNALHQSKT